MISLNVARGWPFALGVLVLLIGAIIGVVRWLHREPGPPVSPPVVILPDSETVAHRPASAPPSGATRITRHAVPVERAVSAGTPDTALARHYADAVSAARAYRDTVEAMRRRGDTTSPRPLKPAALLPPVSGTYDGKRLTLWGTRSDGSVLRATARLKPRWSFAMGYGSTTDTVPLLIEDRWWLRTTRRVAQCAPLSAALALAGALLDTEHWVRGAVVGATASALGCAR